MKKAHSSFISHSCDELTSLKHIQCFVQFLWKAGSPCSVFLIILSRQMIVLNSVFFNSYGSFSASKHLQSQFWVVNILHSVWKSFRAVEQWDGDVWQSCVSEYFNHLNSRLDVAELNGAKFYGTAHGTSSPHTHARTHINDTLPYGMLVQPKHPSWLTCLPQRVCLRACWQREERNQEWADWSSGLRPQRESWALRGCEFWGQNMITF